MAVTDAINQIVDLMPKCQKIESHLKAEYSTIELATLDKGEKIQ